VPANLRIVGTMNTADRSVSHLDAAIRRRFGFLPVGPDPDAIAGTVGPLGLAAFFDELNTRMFSSGESWSSSGFDKRQSGG
jgi:5-methylcytosine-specific restriction enzyme B